MGDGGTGLDLDGETERRSGPGYLRAKRRSGGASPGDPDAAAARLPRGGEQVERGGGGGGGRESTRTERKGNENPASVGGSPEESIRRAESERR
nr:unnamed protein product [Digitaria exilis]